jgi:hypothetical protein
MESILNAIVVMGIEEGPVPFQMTSKVMVHSLRKGKACDGKACKDKSFVSVTHLRAMHVSVRHVMIRIVRVRHGMER